MRLFIDSGALVARHNRDDEHHQEAVDLFDNIASGKLPYMKMYCSDYIADEAITTCRVRTRSHRSAVELGEAILTSKSIVVLRVDEAVFQEAWDLFKRLEDLELSFTDCTTASLARKHGILDIFTFDRAFDALGFHRVP